MRVAILAALIFFSSTQFAHANPSFGGYLGLNQTRFRRPAGEPTPLEHSFRTGFITGVRMRLRYWKPVFPQVELSFVRRGTNVDLMGQNIGASSMDYINLSALATMEYPFSELVAFGTAGPELSILIEARQIEGAQTTDVTEFYSLLDLGVSAAVGVMTRPTRWGIISLEARYGMGFLDVSKTESVLKHLGFSLLIGYEYRRTPRTPKDSDGDGIFDDKDRCRSQAEDRNGFEDEDGCPDARDDDDGDSVFDPDDQCPTQAEDNDGVEDEDGCPDPGTSDGDAVDDQPSPTEPDEPPAT